jgi:hypothetical protein
VGAGRPPTREVMKFPAPQGTGFTGFAIVVFPLLVEKRKFVDDYYP